MAKLIPVETFDLVIFGGTGDLAMRKLLPALYHRDHDGQVTPTSRIISVGRSEMGHQEYVDMVGAALRGKFGDEFSEEHWLSFAARLHYFACDALDHRTWAGCAKCWPDTRTAPASRISQRRRPCSALLHKVCASTA